MDACEFKNKSDANFGAGVVTAILQTSGLCVTNVSMMLTVADLDSAPATPNTTALPCAEDRSKKAEDDTVCSDVLCGILDCFPGPETPNTTFMCVAQRFGAGNPTMIQVAQMSCVSVLLVSRVPKLRTLRVACRGGSEQGTSR